MEVWSGAIHSSLTTPLTGIRLIDRRASSQCSIPKDASLSFHAYVDPSRIPLFCFVGPSLEVHCSERRTVDWIGRAILRTRQTEEGDDEELVAGQQCPVGILLHVGQPSGEERSTSTRHATSDLLIYGVLSPQRADLSLRQCSSTIEDRESDDGNAPCELRVYAIALRSDIITKAQSVSTPPYTPGPDSAVTQGNGASGQFLPDIFNTRSPKRRKVATLFEDAAEYHRRVRKKGAAAISEYITRDKSATPQLPQLPCSARIKRETDSNPSQFRGSLDSGLARRRPASVAKQLGTGSRMPSLFKTGSSLSQAPKTSCYSDPSSSQAAESKAQPERSQESERPDSNTFEKTVASNKALLTRTILTCMRLYGFRRVSTRASMPNVRDISIRPVSSDAVPAYKDNGGLGQDIPRQKIERQLHNLAQRDISSPLDTSDDKEAPRGDGEWNDDVEFKEVYHATYRASSFALRRYLKTPVPSARLASDTFATDAYEPPILGKDRATDTVDNVLKLFCETSDAE